MSAIVRVTCKELIRIESEEDINLFISIAKKHGFQVYKNVKTSAGKADILIRKNKIGTLTKIASKLTGTEIKFNRETDIILNLKEDHVDVISDFYYTLNQTRKVFTEYVKERLKKIAKANNHKIVEERDDYMEIVVDDTLDTRLQFTLEGSSYNVHARGLLGEECLDIIKQYEIGEVEGRYLTEEYFVQNLQFVGLKVREKKCIRLLCG